MTNTKSILSVARNTIEKEWRSLALVLLLVLTLLSVFVAGALISVLKEFFMETFSLDAIGNKSMSIFFFFISFWSSFLAIYFGVSTAASDRESGVILQLLSFPISRGEYIAGRVLGCFALVFTYYIIAAFLGMSGISLSAGVWVSGGNFLWSILFNSLIWLSVSTLSLFVGLYLSRLSGFIVLVIMSIFSGSSYIYYSTHTFKEAMSDIGFFKILGAIFYYLLPHNTYWSKAVNVKLFSPEKFNFNAMEIVHFTGSFCLLVIVMGIIFKRKEI